MTEKTKIALIISSTVLLIGGGTYYFVFRKNRKMTSSKQALQSGLVGDILWKVIAREGSSKNYKDLLPLDGGTVGIPHFAVGGLGELYEHMDTQKYFGKSKEEMISKYSNNCRPSGRSGNDTGWGCYSQTWWREGMAKFLNSPESKRIQDKAWFTKMSKVIDNAISNGWSSPRQIAIATGIANSMGAGGFNSLATKNNWDSEKTLNAYVGNDNHRKRRKEAIDKHFKS